MASSQRLGDALQKTEDQLDGLSQSFRELHATLSTSNPDGNLRPNQAASRDGRSSPAIPALSFSDPFPRVVPSMTMASDILLPAAAFRSRRLTSETTDGRNFSLPPIDRLHYRASVIDQDIEDDASAVVDGYLPLTSPNNQPQGAEGERRPSYVKRALCSYSYKDEHLAEHLKTHVETHLEKRTDAPEATKALAVALGDLWERRHALNSTLLNDYATRDEEIYPGHYEVYDIGKHDKIVDVTKRQSEPDDEGLDTIDTWAKLKDVNPKKTAIGRMTILKEPSPFILAGVHFTMGRHFDMNELMQHLVSDGGNNGKTKAYIDRAFESSEIRQRSFFFVFKYHTVVGKSLQPAPWQQFDKRPQDAKLQNHIDIAECSSVLALSLEDDSPKVVRPKTAKRRRRPAQTGKVCDIFSPWHLLSLQHFPDEHHSPRTEEMGRSYYSGPYAFLHGLALEYRDAAKRYEHLNELITKLITPPTKFMFDVDIRDELLFENASFKYIRRYFWSFNVLGTLNDGIKSMHKAYKESFTNQFWEGRHSTIWPHPDPSSADGKVYLEKMKEVRQELEQAVFQLQDIFDRNTRTQKDILLLQNQLFSGTSIKESRKAIEQGDNIKLLTSVSMVFLPLTFVTSVFGMTNINLSVNGWEFPVTMVLVCVPFFILLFVLMTRRGMDAVRKLEGQASSWLSAVPGFSPQRDSGATAMWQEANRYQQWNTAIAGMQGAAWEMPMPLDQPRNEARAGESRQRRARRARDRGRSRATSVMSERVNGPGGVGLPVAAATTKPPRRRGWFTRGDKASSEEEVGVVDLQEIVAQKEHGSGKG